MAFDPLGRRKNTSYKGEMWMLPLILFAVFTLVVTPFGGASAQESKCYPYSVSQLDKGVLDPGIDYFAGLHLMNPDCEGYDPKRAEEVLHRAVAHKGASYAVSAYYRLLMRNPSAVDTPPKEETLFRIAALSILRFDSNRRAAEEKILDLFPQADADVLLQVLRDLEARSADERMMALHQNRMVEPILNGIAFSLCMGPHYSQSSLSARFQCTELIAAVERTSPYPGYREETDGMRRSRLNLLAWEGYNPALLKGARIFLQDDSAAARKAAFEWLSKSEDPTPEMRDLLKTLRASFSQIDRAWFDSDLAKNRILKLLPKE